jgi:hypothetical protein
MGIKVIRSSSLTLQGSLLNAQIRYNQKSGIHISEHSSGRFGVGTEIYNNTTNGINTSGNSAIYATNISIHDNGDNGIQALRGSSITVWDSSIINNTRYDINLLYGALASGIGNTIGTIWCDATVVREGDFVCP